MHHSNHMGVIKTYEMQLDFSFHIEKYVFKSWIRIEIVCVCKSKKKNQMKQTLKKNEKFAQIAKSIRHQNSPLLLKLLLSSSFILLLLCHWVLLVYYLWM